MKSNKVPMSFDKVRNLIQEDMKKVEELIYSNSQSDALLIPTIANHLNGSGGKRIRAMLLVLSSKICGHFNGDQHILNSCIIELIHTATLLHDDVVDEAATRRGLPSANEKWGNVASVLVGDFLFSKSLILLASGNNSRITESISSVSKELAEGEIMELSSKASFDISELEYLNIVHKKTASLISVSCEVGAILGNISLEKEKALSNFGFKLGVAFQLVDDALDYFGTTENFGKTIGRDFQEKVITLPLLVLFQKASAQEKKKIQELVLSNNNHPGKLQTLLDLMEHYNVNEYVLEKANNYISEAKQEMLIFEETPFLNAILALADYVVTRKN